ncbi:MAG: Rieske 2Fe-2S domain-containing protein [Deltaproteobacteria bacterium]|nr:Rieske 2Fe-2S domain-containing protein [Deltaproteobacteria bacterium]
MGALNGVGFAWEDAVPIIKPVNPDGTDPSQATWSRRDFFALTGWAGFLGGISAGLLAFGRFMFPRVLFEPATAFKAGFPVEYSSGEVSERWIKAQRTWIIRDGKGFCAIEAKCTHLGCTPRWFKDANKFKCPCHGSGFKGFAEGMDSVTVGINFEGPAPRPLERIKVALAEDGQLLIDKGPRFRFEKDEWGKPGSFLKVG